MCWEINNANKIQTYLMDLKRGRKKKGDSIIRKIRKHIKQIKIFDNIIVINKKAVLLFSVTYRLLSWI